MTDISKCSGKDCPIKHKCKRFTAQSHDLWQSHCDFKYDHDIKQCYDFLGDMNENRKS